MSMRICSGRCVQRFILAVGLLVVTVSCQETRDDSHAKLSVASSALTTPITEAAARDAVGLLPEDVVSISFGGSDQAGLAIQDVSTASFPTSGSSYLVMSSGSVGDAFTPNTAPNTSTILAGTNNQEGQDMVQAVFTLRPPATASCLAVDFRFFSEEFPEYVGSQYNDAFIMEIGQSTFQIVNSQVIAPNNFAFDTQNNVISVNTTFGVNAANATGTTYDGGTGLLTAKTPLENPGEQITVTLSIMDLGDSIFDSTVFVDNIRWLYGVACEAGADTDSDRDSLLDSWETNGIDFDKDGVVDLDLPAMGANPQHKDVFIEIDYMSLPGGSGMTGHTHKPKLDALQRVIQAFANAPVNNPDGTTGIVAHIDAGSDTIMNPVTGATWGARSESNALAHQNNLGTCPGGNYDWTAFDAIKGLGSPGNFSVRRADVFHYNIFAHSLCPDFTTTSGISRGIPASDFIVSLGGWTGDVGSVGEQAGTLLHEFGHNLSLKHGGDNHWNYKPNYLSVMNYSFQTRGLRISGLDGTYDYSRFLLPTINEASLDEPAGLSGVAGAAGYGTRFWDSASTARVVNDVNGPIDWNWDGDTIDTGLSVNVNNGTGVLLVGSDNWAEILFNGGSVGHLGEKIDLPVTVPDPEHALVDVDQATDSVLPTDYAVGVSGPGSLYLGAGSAAVVSYSITNTGDKAETIQLTASSPQGWANLSTVPATVALGSAQHVFVNILVAVPSGSAPGLVEALTLSARSASNPAIVDSAVTSITVSRMRIDIKPGSATNPVNSNASVVPVALLGAAAFDVNTIDIGSLTFGPGEAPPYKGNGAHGNHLEDVDGDGILDLVIQPDVTASGVVAPGLEYACVRGQTVDGVGFGDCDRVTQPGRK